MLLNATDIARECNVSVNYVYAVKRTPDSPFGVGGLYTTKEKFVEWVLAHPTFRIVQVERLPPVRRRQPSAAGRSDAPPPMSG